jgi:hypothetical protein
MSGKHWDDDALIGRLYGVGPDDGHLGDCAECAQRWQTLLARRESVLAQPGLPEELMDRQRREVYQRLESSAKRRWWLPFAPVAATAGVVLLAVVLFRSGPAPPPVVSSADSGLYTEVYSLVQTSEPQAVEPIHALFEEGQ